MVPACLKYNDVFQCLCTLPIKSHQINKKLIKMIQYHRLLIVPVHLSQNLLRRQKSMSFSRTNKLTKKKSTPWYQYKQNELRRCKSHQSPLHSLFYFYIGLGLNVSPNAVIEWQEIICLKAWNSRLGHCKTVAERLATKYPESQISEFAEMRIPCVKSFPSVFYIKINSWQVQISDFVKGSQLGGRRLPMYILETGFLSLLTSYFYSLKSHVKL